MTTVVVGKGCFVVGNFAVGNFVVGKGCFGEGSRLLQGCSEGGLECLENTREERSLVYLGTPGVVHTLRESQNRVTPVRGMREGVR